MVLLAFPTPPPYLPTPPKVRGTIITSIDDSSTGRARERTQRTEVQALYPGGPVQFPAPATHGPMCDPGVIPEYF